jgi:hypothetical protein
MNYEVALRKVEEYLQLRDQIVQLEHSEPATWSSNPKWFVLQSQITKGQPLIEQIARKWIQPWRRKSRAVMSSPCTTSNDTHSCSYGTRSDTAEMNIVSSIVFYASAGYSGRGAGGRNDLHQGSNRRAATACSRISARLARRVGGAVMEASYCPSRGADQPTATWTVPA